MIHSVTIQNFKNIRDQTIDLEPLTVFVGANASGKTTVLEAIRLASSPGAVRDASHTGNDHQPAFPSRNHFDWLYTRGGCGDLSVACARDGSTLSFTASPPKGFPPPPDLLGKSKWAFRFTRPDAKSIHDPRKSTRPVAFIRLDAAEVARPWYSDRELPRIYPNGRGVTSVLAYMALNDPDAFSELVGVLKELIPQIRRIRFHKPPITRPETELVRIGNDTIERRMTRVYRGEAILFDFVNAENVAAHTVSEGTLLLLGLLTVLMGPNRPTILLMDDIERGLHPLAQKALLATINRVMERFPDLQILATAHSPYLLDQLKTEQIRLMTIGADGHSVCGRLENHPQFEKWKDEMAPGEMWSLFGEKWIAEGVAAP